MVAHINVTVMVLSMFIFGGLYVYSVLPAHLERKMGSKAYLRCGLVRKASFIFLVIFGVCEIIYLFYPMNTPFPKHFFQGWYWFISIAIGGIISVPATFIMNAATRAAKGESYAPSRENPMYRGIYNHIRHPQMIGDIVYWFAIAFIFNSPFLVFINIIWIPVNLVMILAEEKDLELRYGEAYRAYKNQIPMLFPKKMRLSD